MGTVAMGKLEMNPANNMNIEIVRGVTYGLWTIVSLDIEYFNIRQPCSQNVRFWISPTGGSVRGISVLRGIGLSIAKLILSKERVTTNELFVGKLHENCNGKVNLHKQQYRTPLHPLAKEDRPESRSRSQNYSP